MSLQKCSKCGEVGSFWSVYKAINFGRFASRNSIQCASCKHTMTLDRSERPAWRKLFVGFLWMAPSFVVIALFALGLVAILPAVVMVILFHFASLTWIIKTYKCSEG